MVSLSTLEGIADWIDENLQQDLKIKDVAEHCGYSMWHLQRIFRKTTGMSLGAYIRERRLTCVASALTSKDRSITEICSSFGFRSRPAFTRTFSRYFGITPGLYRERCRADEHPALPAEQDH